jgi:hypothetical protein
MRLKISCQSRSNSVCVFFRPRNRWNRNDGGRAFLCMRTGAVLPVPGNQAIRQRPGGSGRFAAARQAIFPASGGRCRTSPWFFTGSGAAGALIRSARPRFVAAAVLVGQSLNTSNSSPFRRENHPHRSHQTADLEASHSKHRLEITSPHIADMALRSCRFTAIGAT